MIFSARIYVLIYAGVIAACFVTGSILPLLLIGLPNLYGSWLMSVYGFTQHAGLAENVLDHRLNCRTVYMNPLNRYLYWNMNYHVEHHMFPLVPYHQLPKLHALVKSDCPTPYDGLIEAYKRNHPGDPAPAQGRRLLRQARPAAACRQGCVAGRRPQVVSDAKPTDGKWVAVCSPDMIKTQDPLRFDHGNKTFAIYRGMDDRFYATDGFCTHGNTHLADGLVIDHLIECPKHNGRFDFRDGSPARAPVCVALKTYDVRVADGKVWVDVVNAKGKGAIPEKTYTFRVVSNDNVATFIKELVLAPVDSLDGFQFTPGNYMQLDIPAYEHIGFDQFNIKAPYDAVWRVHHVHEYACIECRAHAPQLLAGEQPADRQGSSASTCASPRRRAGRIVPPASAPATSSTSSPATR